MIQRAIALGIDIVPGLESFAPFLQECFGRSGLALLRRITVDDWCEVGARGSRLLAGRHPHADTNDRSHGGGDAAEHRYAFP